METELIALTSTSEEVNWLRDLLFQITYFGSVQNHYYNGKFRIIRRKHNIV